MDNEDITAFLSGWDERIHKYREMLCTDGQAGNKYALLTRARILGTVERSVIESMLEKIACRDGESDFKLIFLVRLLYFDNDRGVCSQIRSRVEATPLSEVVETIDAVISDFPFWIDAGASTGSRDDKTDRNGVGGKNEFKDIVFWSENHVLMYLSSAHLYSARAASLGVPCRCGAREDQLLKVYLRAHVEFSGNETSLNPLSLQMIW